MANYNRKEQLKALHASRKAITVQKVDEDIQRHSNRWYSYEKAKALPTTVIIKSKKL